MRSALESLDCVGCPQLVGSGGVRLRLRLDARGKGRLPREASIGLGVERLGAVEEKGGTRRNRVGGDWVPHLPWPADGERKNQSRPQWLRR